MRNVESGGERVLLSGDVVSHARPGETTPRRCNCARSLTAVPDLDRYSTDAAVEIERGDSMVRSVGMEYDNTQRTVKFHSKVRGTIASTAPGEVAK